MKELTTKQLNKIKELQRNYSQLLTIIDKLDEISDIFRNTAIEDNLSKLEFDLKEIEDVTNIEVFLNLIHEKIYQDIVKIYKESNLIFTKGKISG